MPRERLTGAIGAISALIGIGGAAGSVLAGPLADLLGWRGIFSVPFIAAILGVVLVLALVPVRGVRAEGRVNGLSATLLSAWLVALLVPLSSGAHWGWGSPVTVGLFAGAAVLLIAWVAAELRSRNPLVDLRMLAARAVWPVNAAAFLIGAAAFGFWGYLPQFLETPATTGWGLGLGVQAAGLALLPLLAGMSGIGFAAGAIARILPLRVMLAIGALLMAVGVGSAIASHTALWQLSVAGGLFGLGIGLSYASMSSIVVQSVPADRTGVATGVNANLRTIGSAVGSALMSAIVFGSTGSDGSPAQTGYDVAWLSVAAMAVLAAAIVMAVRPRRSVAQSDDDVETVEDGELASAA